MTLCWNWYACRYKNLKNLSLCKSLSSLPSFVQFLDICQCYYLVVVLWRMTTVALLLQPHVRIWDSETLNTLKMVGAGTLDRAVACISFSATDNGQLLCAVDEHNDHRMSVWDWNKGARGTKLAEMKASQDPVYQAEFHPTEANQIVCCGKNQLSFWTLDSSRNLTKKMALFEVR